MSECTRAPKDHVPFGDRDARYGIAPTPEAAEASRLTDETIAQQTSACLASLEPRDHQRADQMRPTQNLSKHTCAWVFANSKFQEWLDSDKSELLWITAKAGCGKTTLAMHISETI